MLSMLSMQMQQHVQEEFMQQQMFQQQMQQIGTINKFAAMHNANATTGTKRIHATTNVSAADAADCYNQ